MQSATYAAPASKKSLWAGWIIGVLPALLLLSSSVSLSMKAPYAMVGLTGLGYPERTAVGIGIVEFACAVLYLIPRTSVLGAILLTGYLGGATASHVRAGQPFLAPIVVGILFWAGLFLRDPRLRALFSLRAPNPSPETPETVAAHRVTQSTQIRERSGA